MAQPISYRKALREWHLYLLVLPPLGMVLTFAYFPAVSAIYHSFFEWQGGDVKRYIGLDNFTRAWNDSVLWWSFAVIAILVVANVVKLIPSILLAVLIHRLRSARWQYWYRVGVVVPMVVPSLVFLFIWKFFLDPNFGALNRLLDIIGGRALLVWADQLFGWGVFLPDQPIGWLAQPGLVIPSLIIWGFPWIGAVGVLLYLAGLQSIGVEVYEAAEIDGVSSWQRFYHIELPLILTQIRLTLVLLIIGTLQGYGLQLLLLGDNGGPAGYGMVPGLWMYNRAFSNGEFGYACALGLILFAAILFLTLINNRFVRVEK